LAKKIAAASGMMKALFEDKTPEGVSRYENLEAVLNGVKMYEDDFATENEGAAARLVDFMLNVALLTDMDEKDDENDKDRVSLMTIHAAKGLEFPFVYIGGLEENLFPNSMSVNSRAELEEERRLFYVAITRAMKKLTLSFAEMRYKWGEMNFCEPSRFIDEIDGKFVDIPRKFAQKSAAANTFNPLDKKEKTGNVFAKKQISNSAPPPSKDKNFLPGELAKISDIAEGVRVEHARFGHGTVVKVEGEGPNIKASVEFDGFGVKQLILRFARLKLSNK
jgi:DNA helicase-2/ATP-dependent DNA helicase PcrA